MTVIAGCLSVERRKFSVGNPCDKTTLMALFLGIDGGGSKTCCAVGDETSVLGTGAAAGCNLVRVGEQSAQEALRQCIDQACAAANISPRHITRTCAGVAGGGRHEIAVRVHALLAELVSGEIDVVGDMAIALEAAFRGGPGVVVIAGTGSIACGRNQEGETARAGGWGFAVSDEGSGHWIGRSAVSAALRRFDETGRPGELLGRLMKGWDVTSLDLLVLAANGSPAPDFAALLPAVLSAADGDDATARSVLSQAGEELAKLGAIVATRLFPNAAAPVAAAGGVFVNSALVRQIFYERLRARCPQILTVATEESPVDGALALARKYVHS